MQTKALFVAYCSTGMYPSNLLSRVSMQRTQNAILF